MVTISALLDHIWEERAEKPPKKGYFVDAESVRKTIMYLHENLNPKALRAKNSLFFWLNLIASLVKLLCKLDDILRSIP